MEKNYGLPINASKIIVLKEKNPKVPLFYGHEKTGQLKKIVKIYFEETSMDETELNILKWYILQWIETMQPFRDNIPHFEETCKKVIKMGIKKLRNFINSLVATGIDPF